MTIMSSAQDILNDLDLEPRLRFPVLDSAKEFFVAGRLCAYCDEAYWAVTIERLVFATRAVGYKQIRTWIYTFGNCIEGDEGAGSDDIVHPASAGPDGPVFEEYDGDVRLDAASIRLRDRVIGFDASPSSLMSRGVTQVFPPHVIGADLARLLVLDHRDLLLAAPSERTRRIGRPLRQLLQLDEWRHPDILAGEKPSDTESFRLLAAALANCDASVYRPTEPPNTDWRNWPKGGML